MVDLSKSNSHDEEFIEILSIINKAHEDAYRAVNAVLVSMYWDIGKHISEKVAADGWGKSIVEEFSKFVQSRYLGIKGFSPQNIWRMKQFYETYQGNSKLSPLVREITWTNNVLILMGAKTDEAKEFYLKLAAKNNYSKRELERQMDSLLFERILVSGEKNKLFVSKNEGLTALRDSYTLEFLDVPEHHIERDLRKAIVASLKNFILEFGKEFSFVGEEYKVQVGNSDFLIDLLFFNRELACLVAIELKVRKFKPGDLGQLEFYLEALDRDVKLPNENPSVGLVLCAAKDDTVVEYALSRSMSPALVADYQLHLPDKELLERKIRELSEYAEFEDSEEPDEKELVLNIND